MAQLPPGVSELPPGVSEISPVSGENVPTSPLSALPKGPGGYPIVPLSMRGQVRTVPSMGTMALKNLREQWPELAAMAVGTPIRGPLKAAIAGGGTLAGGRLAQGAEPTDAATAGGIFGGTSAGVHGLAKGILATAGSRPLRNAFASDTMQKLGDYLKSKVPALSPFASNEKGVHDMLMSPEGYNALHTWYDKYFKDLSRRGLDLNIEIPLADAKALGIPVVGEFKRAGANTLANPAREGYGLVNATQAAEKTIGQWKRHPGEFGRVNEALDSAGLGDPAMRAGYKTVMGTREFLGRQNAFKGERYNPELASKGLSIPGLADTLNRRGLGDVYKIIRGPGGHPITPTNISPWTRRMIGGSVGEGIGYLAGGSPAMGFVPGAAAGELLIPATKGAPVPQGIMDLIRGLSLQGGAQGTRLATPPPQAEGD